MIDRIASLATSTLANALDDTGYHDKMMPGIKTVAAGFRFAGPAVTVKETSGEFGSFRRLRTQRALSVFLCCSSELRCSLATCRPGGLRRSVLDAIRGASD